ncbi:hypothetical protein ACFLQL_02310 [Verrucomicrobiota bacterium]
MKYTLYKPMINKLAHEYVVKFKIPKEQRNKQLVTTAITNIFPLLSSSYFDANVVISEDMYYFPACTTYFVLNNTLINLLDKSRMDVNLRDINLDKFPKAFSIAWPEESRLNSIMLCFNTNQGYYQDHCAFINKYKLRVHMAPWDSKVNPNELILQMFHMKSDALYGAQIPEHDLNKSLRSLDSYKSGMANEHCTSNWDEDLNEEEYTGEYNTLRLALRLLVYMSACPKSIKSGFPNGKIYDVGSKYYNPTPTTIGFPDHCEEKINGLGTHESPEMHWRNWHFRSYPIKKDNTKTAGVVFVNGTVVMGKVDPYTVEQPAMVT